ncbi:MAG: hypothetical protein IJ862_03005 [Selenomonadaceae bacterium]|nr:hypothetical protein [Selenomonadaceae bacterium]
MDLCIKSAVVEGILMASILIIFADKLSSAFAIDDVNLFQLVVDAIRF